MNCDIEFWVITEPNGTKHIVFDPPVMGHDLGPHLVCAEGLL